MDPVLRQAGLVVEGKRGKWVPYSMIEPEAGTFPAELLQSIRLLPQEVFAMDIKRMRARLSLRKSNECIVGMNSDVAGLLMHLLFRKDEAERTATGMKLSEPEAKRALWKNVIYFASLVASK